MEDRLIDILVFAPLAPLLGIILFWFIQMILVEFLKYNLSKIWNRHGAFCRFSNFMGLFFQSLTHVMGYTLTGIGVDEFSLGVDNENVRPKREKEGLPKWLADVFITFGPFFVPPLMIFLVLLPSSNFLKILDFNYFVGYGFSNVLTSFGVLMERFGLRFISMIVNIDLFNPFHVGFMLLLIIVGLGIRPSYIEGDKRVDMMYDLRLIKNLMAAHPLYFVSFICVLYIIFYVLFLFHMPFYVLFFSFFGWLSVIAIVAVLIAMILIAFIRFSDRTASYLRFIPFIVFIASYILIRVFFLIFPNPFKYSSSIVVSTVASLLAGFLLAKFENDKVKMLATIERIEEMENER